MNTTTTLIHTKDYEVVAEAYVSDEELEVTTIMYHCNKSAQAIDITDFIYDYFDTNDLEQQIFNNQ